MSAVAQIKQSEAEQAQQHVMFMLGREVFAIARFVILLNLDSVLSVAQINAAQADHRDVV